MKGLAKTQRMAGHAPFKIDYLQRAINAIIVQVRSNIIALVQFTQSDRIHMQLALSNSTYKVLGWNLDECDASYEDHPDMTEILLSCRLAEQLPNQPLNWSVELYKIMS